MLKHRNVKVAVFLLLVGLAAVAVYFGVSEEPQTKLSPGDLKIVKVIVEDSKTVTEYGEESDFIEILNTTDREIHIKSGEWFITDKGTDRPFRFPLPELFIDSGEKIKVWCDGQDMHGNEIHTNFKLDEDGEWVAIFIKDEKGEVLTIDSFEYDEAEDVRGFKKVDGETVPVE
ncbi:lamin tail domain-containing protein [Halocola ammonii]